MEAEILKSYKVDIAVLLIFFSRPEQFSKVFKQVKLARPSRLYLYQDGPREGRAQDLEGIQKCRRIVSAIDWDCEVHTYYQRENVGCDPSEFIAQKWMFQTEEMGIVLEDDDVPSQSFFPFCKELLERFRYDERINMICGMNNTGICEYTPYDYVFTTSGSICGWASWKRVVDTWDEHYKILDDEFNLRQMYRSVNTFISAKQQIDASIYHRRSGRAHYETILSNSMFLEHRLNIVAAKNMISNIGITSNSAHSVDHIKMLPKGIRRIFQMQVHDISFPLKHPPYVIDDLEFRKRIYRIMGVGHPMIRFYRRVERVYLRIRWKGVGDVLRILIQKLKL